MATYRILLRVDVEDRDIVRSRDADALESFKEGAMGDEYLAYYIEDEIAWLHQSFNNIQVEEIQRITDE